MADASVDWPLGLPAEHGLDPTMLAAMEDHITAKKVGVHGVVLIRHGVLVYESYYEGSYQIFDWVREEFREPAIHAAFDAATKHPINSVTKCVVSLLVGIAVDRGLIKDIDAPVFDYFPEHADLRTPEKNRITIRHLLTMSDGFEWDEYPSVVRLYQSAAPYRHVLALPLSASPGSRYIYNSGSVYLLDAILRKTSGLALEVLAKETLFEPLGISDIDWESRHASGNVCGAGGLALRPRDLAKFGELVLRRGTWHGKRIVSDSWIAQATFPQIDNVNDGFSQLFGFLFWVGRYFHRDLEVRWIKSAGFGGQRVFMFPELDLVVVGTAFAPDNSRVVDELLNKFIIPATTA